MNAITFLALLFTSGYAVIPVLEPRAVPPALEVRGFFNCTYNEDAVTIEIRDQYRELLGVGNDNNVDSKNVSLGDHFGFIVWLPWSYIQPYIVIRHRCNPCNKDTVVEYCLNSSPPELLPRLCDFGVINLDNLESSRCSKWL
uniref:Uncharacterized protein n=1 Tax=Haemonchus contortus TaxID=6289 RepID=W6NA43_HAECO